MCFRSSNAAGVAASTAIVGTAIGVPLGSAIGFLASRVNERRVFALVASTMAGCFAATLFVRILFPVHDLFVVLLPAFAMAVVAAQVLERWTRP